MYLGEILEQLPANVRVSRGELRVVLGRERVGVLQHDVRPEVGVPAVVGVEAQLGVEQGVDGVVLDGEHLGGRPRVGAAPGHQHVPGALVLDNRAAITQVSVGLEQN